MNLLLILTFDWGVPKGIFPLLVHKSTALQGEAQAAAFAPWCGCGLVDESFCFRVSGRHPAGLRLAAQGAACQNGPKGNAHS